MSLSGAWMLRPASRHERVLGFLHVAEEPAEMHDAGRIGLVETDAALETDIRWAWSWVDSSFVVCSRCPTTRVDATIRRL